MGDGDRPNVWNGSNTHHGDSRDLIQVGTVHGNIELVNAPHARPRPRPRQLPPRPGVFRNQQAALRVLNEEVPPGPCRAVISGPPGSGKTALALHWVNLRRTTFQDGQIYLDLRGHDRARLLSPVAALTYLLESIGADRTTLPSDPDALAALWRTESYELDLLVILDNAADVDQLRPLLSNGPRTVTVITSRDTLSGLRFIEGTRFTHVGPLDTEHSIGLLRQLIEPLRGPLDQGDLEELAGLCGNLQLALVVAAQLLVKRSETALPELSAELRAGERLFEPVRLVFNSAYTTLAEGPACLFRRLGLAPGPDVSRDAIVALSGLDVRAATRDIEALLGASLLSRGRPGRFVLHDLLHAYAGELVWDADHQPEAVSALERLAAWYTRKVLDAARAIGAGPDVEDADPAAHAGFADGVAAHAWFTEEAVNLNTLLTHLSALDLSAATLGLCSALIELYELGSPLDPWRHAAEIGLELSRIVEDSALESRFLESLGKASTNAHDYPQALDHHKAALRLRTQSGDRAGQVRSLNTLGIVHCRSGMPDEAERTLRECLALARELGDGEFKIYAWMNLGFAALCRGRTAAPANAPAAYAEAVDRLDTALSLLADVEGMHFYRANALQDRAEALAALGHLDHAAHAAAEAVRIAREQAVTPLALAPALRASALVRRAQGDIAGANSDLVEAAEILRTLGDYVLETEYRSLIDESTA